MESGYDDKQLIAIKGICFVAKIYGAWVDGKFIEVKDFTPEIKTSLLTHHAETLKARIESVGD